MVKIRATLGPYKYDAAIAKEDEQRTYKTDQPISDGVTYSG